MMGLEYAVWGAWMPVLAVRLLGPLKMTGKQTGWIYATFPLGLHLRSAGLGLPGRQPVQCRVDYSDFTRHRGRVAVCGGEADEVLGHVLDDAGLLDLLHGHAAAGEQHAVPAIPCEEANVGLLLGAGGLGSDVLPVDRHSPGAQDRRRRARLPLSGRHPLGSDGRRLFLPRAAEAGLPGQSHDRGDGHAEEHATT